MKKINIDDWKEFRVIKDLNFSCFHGIRQNKADREEGKIPLLTAGKENQGVSTYISNALCVYKDSITIDMFGNCFFHEGEYAGDDNIYFFINNKISKNCKIFIATTINSKNSKKYAYNEQFRQTQADNLTIKLPTTRDGEPDWQYMEDYMKKAMVETQKKIEQLKKVNCEKKGVDIGEWKEFRVGDLFEFIKIVGDLQAQKQEEGNIPLISSGMKNNGVCMYINTPNEKCELIKGDKITVDMFGKSFYQAKDFYAVSHARVNVLKPKFEVNKYIGQYISSVIESKTIYKYSFSEMCSQSALNEETIKLPVTPDGEPDWQYMEDYMKKVMNKAQENLKGFKKIEF